MADIDEFMPLELLNLLTSIMVFLLLFYFVLGILLFFMRYFSDCYWITLFLNLSSPLLEESLMYWVP